MLIVLRVLMQQFSHDECDVYITMHHSYEEASGIISARWDHDGIVFRFRCFVHCEGDIKGPECSTHHKHYGHIVMLQTSYWANVNTIPLAECMIHEGIMKQRFTSRLRGGKNMKLACSLWRV